jgi:hypothetical protein
MNIPAKAPWVLLLPALLTCGCSAVHSTAVRTLIRKEGEKLVAANQAAANFTHSTGLRAEALGHAVSDLNGALKKQQTSELVHALIFSANQNVGSKQGVDAHAVAYMVGQLYLTEQAGLEKKVNDQFTQDIAALGQQAQRIQRSWAALASLQEKIQGFANQSGFASVDANFIAAIADEIPGASAEVDTVLKNAQSVNNDLKLALGLGAIKTPGTDRVQTQISDVIDLLDRVKAGPRPNAP